MSAGKSSRAAGRGKKGRAANRARVTQPLRAHPLLYQINTWAWLERLSRAAGRQLTLGDVPEGEWDRLRDRGFDLVYLLGVWQRSPAGRRIFRSDPAAFRGYDQALPGWSLADVVGSPFSIRAYVPDERIGSWAEIDRVRAKLHARGMRLVLDFVVNHTGPDHVWLAKHPEYFVQGREHDYQRDPGAFHLLEAKDHAPRFVARGRDPYFAPWADTAQIDHFNPDARAALIESLRTIARHCDGLRCDMAMLAVNAVFARTWSGLLGGRRCPETEFWREAIGALPNDFVWMAEVYWDMEAQLLDLGFRFAYDKRLYDRLLAGSADEVRAHLSADIGYQSRMARFIENHDEPRSAAAFGRQRIPGLAALIATLPGLRFFHDGQFEGKSVHLPMPLARSVEEPPDEELVQTYARVLASANAPELHQGDWGLLSVAAENDETHRSLVAYRWRSATGYWLIVVNLGAAPSHGRLHLADDLVGRPSYAFIDKLTDARYVRERADLEASGLYVRLDAHRAHVFEVCAA